MRTICIALAIIIAGCAGDRSGKSASPLPTERFSAVYAQLLLASIDLNRDSLGPTRRVDSVLAGQSVTREEFNATIQWCNEDMSRWDGVMEEVVRILDEKTKEGVGNATER
jgi:hypothetical protein